MDKLAQALIPPSRIDLAREADFTLGPLRVRPSRREVEGDGVRRVLQPRVMQVLVALAHSPHEVVSQHELVVRCWGGLSISDDAIGRCIAQLRRLAADWPEPPFEIETIAGVGYRLEPGPRQAPAAQPDDLPRSRGPARLWLWIAAGTAAAALAGAGAWMGLLAHHPRPTAPRVELASFQALEADLASRDFAARLSDEVADVLKDNVAGVTLLNPADGHGAGPPDVKLSGTVSRDDGGWRVQASLEDPVRHVTLWAQQFRRPLANDAALELEVAAAAGEAIGTFKEVQEDAARRDPPALALLLQAHHDIADPTLVRQGESRRLLEEAVARAPDYAAARAHLALALLLESFMGAPGERGPLFERARQEAQTAIKTNAAGAGAAYDTLFRVTRLAAPGDLAAAEDVLIEGSAKAPGFPFLAMRRCSMLDAVGLAREALVFCLRGLALEPLAAPLQQRYAETLYAMGSPELARRAIERAVSLHPDHVETRRVQFELAAFSGAPEAASVLLHQPVDTYNICGCGIPIGAEGVRALDLFLAARKSGKPGDAETALAAMKAAVGHHQLYFRYPVLGAVALGRLDAAFAMLDDLAKVPHLALASEPGFLFEGPSGPLQRDRRFWPIAARAGFVRYWRARGVLPDFCSDPSLPYDCRAEEARVANIPPQGAR